MNDPINVVELLWLLPTGIAAFGVKFLRDLSLNVKELNTNVAVIMERVSGHERMLEDHEDRIRTVELT